MACSKAWFSESDFIDLKAARGGLSTGAVPDPEKIILEMLLGREQSGKTPAIMKAVIPVDP